jgi:hypothetical protein
MIRYVNSTKTHFLTAVIGKLFNMKTNNEELLFGYPIAKMYDLLANGYLSQTAPVSVDAFISQIREKLEIDTQAAFEVLRTFANEGLLQVGDIDALENKALLSEEQETINAQNRTQTFKPMSKTEADELLVEFLQRVKVVCESDDFLYRVDTVKVFGDYVSRKKNIERLFVFLTFECKIKGEGISMETYTKLYEDLASGKTIDRHFDSYFAPVGKMIKFLDMQERGLEIFTVNEQDFMCEIKWKQIYPKKDLK